MTTPSQPETLPDAPLDAADLLSTLGALPAGCRVSSISTAGVGNMNRVERIHLSNGTTLILKRAQPWVEKYPDIPAPLGRAAVEAAFYRAVARTPAGALMPSHLGFWADYSANLLEDFGPSQDALGLYNNVHLAIADLDALLGYLAALHTLPAPTSSLFANTAMRALNATHIFDFPLRPDNGLALDALTPGLQALATQLQADAPFVATVQQLGRRYLTPEAAPEDVLLHGDFYPGSWLYTAQGMRIIDPEFCWVGPREWDLGVLVAHLWLARQMPALVERVFTFYPGPVNRVLAEQFAGVEIMRRLLGVAQLPLNLSLAQKSMLLGLSRSLVLGA